MQKVATNVKCVVCILSRQECKIYVLLYWDMLKASADYIFSCFLKIYLALQVKDINDIFFLRDFGKLRSLIKLSYRA